jgi:DNA (cytosine-5)-methyltransferase 1
MVRVIKLYNPNWLIIENVPGIINMELDTVLSDLENEVYTCQTFNIPACGVDAKHRRARIWIVANSTKQRRGTQCNRLQKPAKFTRRSEDVSNSKETMCEQSGNTRTGRAGFTDSCRWLPEPNVGRVVARVPRRVDRLKSLGNAVVPQIPEIIGRAILEVERNIRNI